MARTKAKEEKNEPKSESDRMAQLAEVARGFRSWRPARQVLEVVRSVPTIFPQINYKTRIGGWPIQRIAVIHGPSNNGKTAIVHGLGLSFLLAGHFYAYVDAEFTTPIDWIERMMGKFADNPAFVALRPRTYEETVDAVRSFVDTIAKARAENRLPADTTALIAVDSLRKLVPERLREKILKKGAEGKEGSVDGMAGRAAQYKAFLNSAWLDELVPLMAHSNMAMLIVGREAENDDPFSESWKLTGGKGLEFDSSLIARVSRAAWIKRGEDVVGERLQVRIRKTKIGGKDDKVVDCYVHLSNGVAIPEGFDRSRDLLELAIDCGAVIVKGSWYYDGETGESLGQGEHATALALAEDAGKTKAVEESIARRKGNKCE